MEKSNTNENEQEASKKLANKPSDATNDKDNKTVGMGKCNMDDVMALFDAECQAPVELTEPEIVKARETRRMFNKQYRSFNKAPIYRALHSTARSLFEVAMLMPKKTSKISDVVLQYYAEVCRWTASAYEQDRKAAKHLSLNEAISLMNTIRILCNSLYQVHLVGKAKSEELKKQCDLIMRQLVAWRGSLQDQGDYADE